VIDNTDTTVPVCPDCDSAEITPRTDRSEVRHQRAGDPDADWHCGNCQADFDEPARREPTAESPAYRTGTQAQLLAMDPEALP
jgi:hypothetical protein